MSDSSPRDAFAFTPVPSASTRHDGWTPERQRAFIAALREIGVVSWAAEAAGMSRKSAYGLLKRAGPESSFAFAWREAQAAGHTAVLFAAFRRAVEGVEEPYFYGGLQRGTRRVYDSRMLIAAYRSFQRMQGHG
jgi:hypothetical protein